MTHNQVVGMILWVIIFYPVWSPRCWRIRRQIRAEQTAQEQAETQRAERAIIERRDKRVTARETGPAWEQDEPYQECFDTDETEDDL